MATLNLFPFRLSTTQDFEVFNQCKYKWFKQRVEWWIKFEPNIHLEFGKDFAGAMQTTFIAYHRDCLPEVEAIQLGLQYILDTYAETFAVSNWNDSVKTPSKMQEVFIRYFQEFPLDSDITPFMVDEDNISVEQSFEVELPYLHPELGTPLIMSIKPDMIGFDTYTGVCTLKDEKTAGQSGLGQDGGAKQTDKYRTKNQFIQYATVWNNFIRHKLNLTEDGRDYEIKQVVIRRVVMTKGGLVNPKDGLIPSNKKVVEEYKFGLDRWFQEEWWETTLQLVHEMLESYVAYTKATISRLPISSEPSRFFRRSYGNCEQFFQPCHLTGHCTDGSKQDLERLGYKQFVFDKETGSSISLKERRQKLGLPIGE
jgi:hypothetical protein